MLKLLCPRDVVGAVIGKGGATATALVESSGARIKISQNSELYPGTTDRIILVHGIASNVREAVHKITLKISEVINNMPLIYLLLIKMIY